MTNTIEAELPDGTILEFPEDTSLDVVRQTVRRRLGVGTTTAQSRPGAMSREPDPTAQELETASRPARAVTTRGGRTLIVPESELQSRDNYDRETQGEQRAPWTGEGGVIESLPAQAVAAGRGAMANLRRMGSEEAIRQRSSVLDIDPVTQRAEYLDGRDPPLIEPDPTGPVTADPRRIRRALDRQADLIVGDQVALERAERDARNARVDMELVTPKGMNTPQQAVSSLAQSAPPTLAGISAAILTRNPSIAMAIAGGGGAAFQAGSTYGEAREKGATHKTASIAASIDAILEGVGEALPLGIALRSGTPVMTRIYNTMLAEAGQEAATQAMQDLNAYLTYDPNITLKEAWDNLKVAALSGAMGGSLYGTAGAMLDRQQHALELQPDKGTDLKTGAPVDAAAAVAQQNYDQQPQAPAVPQEPVAAQPLQRDDAVAETQQPQAVVPVEPASPTQEALPPALAVASPQGVAQIAPEAPPPLEPTRVRVASTEAPAESPEAVMAAPEEGLAPMAMQRPTAGNDLRGERRIKLHGVEAFVAPRSQAENAATPLRARISLPGRSSPQISGLIGPDRRASGVFLIDQVSPDDGSFQAVVPMLGFTTQQDAEAAYSTAHAAVGGKRSIGGTTQMSPARFQKWITSRRTSTRLSAPTSASSSPVAPSHHVATENLIRPQIAPRVAAPESKATTTPTREALPDARTSPSKPVRSATANPTASAHADAARIIQDSRSVVEGSQAVVEAAKELVESLTAASLKQSVVRDGLGTFETTTRARAREDDELQIELDKIARGGLTVSQIRDAVDPLLDRWKNAPSVVYLPTVRVAPAEIRAEDNRQRAGGAQGAIEGVWWEGKIYLFADAIESPERAIAVALHETLGHFGLRGVFGDKFGDILRQLANARPGEVRKKAESHGLDPANEEDRLLAAEELLAELAQSRPELNIVQRAIAVIRNWLRTNGIDIQWSDEDLIQAFLLPARRFVERGNGDTNSLDLVSRATPSSRPVLSRSLPKWVEDQPDRVKEALRKSGVVIEDRPLPDRTRRLMDDFWRQFRQGIFDQYDPLKELDYRAYMMARMSKSVDQGLEAMLLYGLPHIEDGALNVRTGNGGLLNVLEQLNGEHDRFLAWIAGNRAHKLRIQGRENLFTAEDISALRDLDKGKMPDGGDRASLYDRVHKRFNAYSKAVLDIAEETGLISVADRAIWESDFYVPFYRVLQDGNTGPNLSKGLVNQSAFHPLKGGRDQLNDLLANTLRNWSHLLSASMKNQAARLALEAAVEASVALEVPSRAMGNDMDLGSSAVSVLDKGQPRHFVVADPFVFDAITSLGWSGFDGPLMKTMGLFKRWLTFGVTVNPTFRIRNLMRDVISAMATSELSYNPFRNVTEGWKATAPDSENRAALVAGGAIFRFGAMLDGDSAAHVRRLIDSGVHADSILDTPEKAKRLIVKLLDAYQEHGDRFENANRAALYGQLRAQGVGHLEASFEARDLLDFTAQGKWRAVRFLVQTVPFFNARLQGLYKLGRSTQDNPQKLAYVMGAVVLASIALFLLQHDDEDWKKREEWDRDNFWWFKVGGIAYRIPKPFEIGAVGSLAERSLEWLMSQDRDAGRRFAHSLLSIVMSNLSMNPVPQLFKPMLDLYANRDSFRERPIESQRIERLPKSDRIGTHTTLPAIWLGKAGILSPVEIDHLARAYFGWLGGATFAAVDALAGPLVDMPSRPAMRLRDWFVVGNFAEELPASQSRYVTLFYEQSKEVQEAYAAYRQAIQLGQGDRAKEILARDGDKVMMQRYFAVAQRHMAEIHRQERLTMADRKLSPEAKRERLATLSQRKHQIADSTWKAVQRAQNATERNANGKGTQ